jgi:hypothetical protein
MSEITVDSPLNQPSPAAPPQGSPPPSNGSGGAAQSAPAQPAPEPQAKPVPETEVRRDGWLNGKATLPLRKKVMAHGDMVGELVFREPTGGDIERIGQPVILSIFEANPKPIYDPLIMSQMMAHLATVPPSTIRALDPRDWNNGALMLFHFFVPDRWTS